MSSPSWTASHMVLLKVYVMYLDFTAMAYAAASKFTGLQLLVHQVWEVECDPTFIRKLIK